MMDLFCRACKSIEAMKLMNNMPLETNAEMWKSFQKLLESKSTYIWGVELPRIFVLEFEKSGTHVLLCKHIHYIIQ